MTYIVLKALLNSNQPTNLDAWLVGFMRGLVVSLDLVESQVKYTSYRVIDEVL